MGTTPQMDVVDKLYAAFGAQDAAAVGTLVTDDFRIEIPQMDHVPLESVYEGARGFAQLLTDRRQGEISYDVFEEDGRVAQGDYVVVIGHTEGRALSQGRPFKHGWVHVFRFDGERISSFKEYIDSSSVCAACCP